MKETIKWMILVALIMGIVGEVGAFLEDFIVGGMAEVIDHSTHWEHYIPFLVCGLGGLIVGFFRGRMVEERQILEKTFQEEHILFLNSIEAFNHPFYVIDINNYSILLMNSATRKGYPVHNDLMTCFALTHGESRPCSEKGEVCPLEIVKRTKKPVVVEHTHFDKDGNTGIFDVHCYPIFNDKGKVHQVIEYSLDITERKQAEKALYKTKSRLEYLLTSTPAVIYTSEPHGDFQTTFMSENIKELVGYEAQEFLSKPDFWVNLMRPEDRERIFASYSEIPKKGYYSEIYRVRHKNGTYHWVLEEAKLIEDEEGNPLDIVGYWSDITEQKQSELKLQESEEKYRLLVEKSSDGIAIIQDRKYKYVNPSFAKIVGHSSNELLNFSPEEIWSLIHPDDKEGLEKRNRDLEAGLPLTPKHIFRYISKDGSTRWVEASGTDILFEGRPALQVFENDITERKLAELKLRESEEKYRMILENIEEGYYEVDLAGNFTFLNDSLAISFGYSKDELIGMNNRQYMDEKNAKKIYKIFNEVYKTGKPKGIVDWEIIRKDGIKRFHEDSVALISDSTGNPIGFRGIARDVTERKQLEINLEKRNHDIKERIKELNCLYSLSKLTSNVNKSLKEIFREALLFIPLAWQYPEITCIRIIHEENTFTSRNFQKTPWKQRSEILVGGIEKGIIEVFYLEEKQFLKEEQDLIDALARELGEFIERKNIEKTLKGSEKKYRTILETIQEGYYEIDLDGNFTFFNDSLCKIFGYSRSELMGLHYKEYMDEETAKEAYKTYNRVFQTNQPIKLYEYEHIRKDKTRKDIDASISLMTDFKDNPIGFQGIIRDITEYKQTMRELQESEDRFKTIFENANDGIIIAEKGSKNFFLGNQTISRMLDYDLEEFVTLGIHDIHPKEELHHVLAQFEKQAMGEITIAKNIPMKRKNGTIFYADVNASSLTFSGKSFLMGIFRDITERKLLEEALAQARDFLTEKVEERTRELFEEKNRIASIVDTVPVGILVLDPSGTISLSNKTCNDIHNRIFQKSIPTNFNINTQPDHLFFNEIKKIFFSEESSPPTIEPIKGYHLQLLSARVNLPNGELLGVIIEFYDVTPFIEFEITQKQFVATVSHELRTPITILDLSIKNLQKYWMKLSVKQREEVFRSIIKSTFSLKQIIEDVLTISKIETRELKLELMPFYLMKVLNDLIAQFDSRLREFNVTVQLEINPQLELYGDSKRIGKIFSILLDNAIKFSPDEESTVKIIAIDDYRGEYNPEDVDGVLIQVIDSGRGIPEKDLPLIFDLFFKSIDEKDTPGIGIGLFIAKTLVNQHQGHIFVRSRIGKGSTFSIFLPKSEAKSR